MLTLRRAHERGHARHGWLESWHTFSFAEYRDPRHDGFRNLRVINEDRVQPGMGFPTHPHRDMEILSYVLSGALVHRDSLGNGSTIRPGEVQRMSAGTGVTHSEANASARDPVHFLQIWFHPRARGLPPSYEQRAFSDADKRGRLVLVASPDGAEGSVTVHADARLRAGLFRSGESAALTVPPGRHAWVHVARGQVRVNGHTLAAGDGAALSDEPSLHLDGLPQAATDTERGAEVLVFDLP